MLISYEQQDDSSYVCVCIYIYVHFLISFSTVVCQMLNTAPRCRVAPCCVTALQFAPAHPELSALPTPASPLLPRQPQVCSLCLSLVLFHRHVDLYILDSTYKGYHMVSLSSWLTSLRMLISRSMLLQICL